MGILTYAGNRFYMDGEPFVVISGAMHYFRIPRAYWRDRLLKLKECGFNCVETYTCWNLHEPEEGKFDFSGMLDVAEYIRTAAEVGLYVILRPGPYICAEWDFGGLPAWLLRYKDMELRCMDGQYLSKVRRYFAALFPQLMPHFGANGGNIVMLQIENEYGSYGNDKAYLQAILDMYREMGIDCLFFTSDGPRYSMLSGGTLPGVLSVANFGSKPEEHHAIMEECFPDQPYMCGEYWDGWFEHWGEEAQDRPAHEVVEDFKTFMEHDWSVNMYMFHGGTNFGFCNGANHFGTAYLPTISSYDYGAILTEAGDRTPTYYRLRDILVARYGSKVPTLTAQETPKKAYGKVRLTQRAGLWENLPEPVTVVAPKFMEDIGQNFGYVLYRGLLKGPSNDWPLNFAAIHDRAQIFVDGCHRQTYLRDEPIPEERKVRIPLGQGQTARLDILVENMGRVNYGRELRDQKGAVGMCIGNQFQYGWQMYPLPMDDLTGLRYEKWEGAVDAPAFLKGELEIHGEPCDTFLRLDGFTKGFVTVNGFNLGRYWKIGPTKTLYVPAPVLRQGKNEIVVFESDGTACPEVEFLAEPDLGRENRI